MLPASVSGYVSAVLTTPSFGVGIGCPSFVTIIVGHPGLPTFSLLVHLEKPWSVFLVPLHSISNVQYLAVLWVFAVPMFDSKYYGIAVVSHFHPKLVSSVFLF